MNPIKPEPRTRMLNRAKVIETAKSVRGNTTKIESISNIHNIILILLSCSIGSCSQKDRML